MIRSGEDRKRWGHFGRFVRALREAKRLSQAEAASRAGMSDRHWKRLEAGASGTTRNKVPAIAHALDADLNETFLNAGFAPPEGPYYEPQFAKSQFADIYRKFQSLTTPQQNRLRLILEMLDREVERMLEEGGGGGEPPLRPAALSSQHPDEY